MRLAVFFPASLFSAWACSYGLVDCLKRMGHDVTALPVQPDNQNPPIGAVESGLGGYDGMIISGPEHIAKSERCVVLGKKLPTVAWLHETVEREDYGKLDVDAIKRSADIVICPGIQDEKYGFRYLPFGVDTEIFKPTFTDSAIHFQQSANWICPQCGATGLLGAHVCPHSPTVKVNDGKSIDAAFIGLLYPKRQAFLKELKSQGVSLITGNVQVLELGGVNPRKTAELYAENIRKIKVFVNLPTLSQLAVTKIYEVLACGTPILTPEVSDMRNFHEISGAVTIYADAKDCARKLGEILPVVNGSAGHVMQPAVADDARIRHRLELRCEKLISALQEIGTKAA